MQRYPDATVPDQVLRLVQYLIRQAPFTVLANQLSYGMSDNLGILADLGPLLSPKASIVLPSHPEFPSLVARWREYEAPDITVVVQIAVESDVQQTVSVYNSFR